MLAGFPLLGFVALPLEVNASFPHLHFILALLALIYFLRKRVFFWLALSFFALVIQFTTVFWPVYSSSIPSFSNGTELSILYSNVYVHNKTPEKLRALIQKQQPAVICLTEVSQEWLDKLDIGADYPYSYLRPGKSADGNAIYSRLPLSELRRVPEEGYFASLFARIELSPLSFAYLKLIHAPPPQLDPAGLKRLEFFTELAKESRENEKSRTILVGDFNTASSNRLLGEIVGLFGLRLASNGWFDFPTWRPVEFPLLVAPIDHLAIGRDVFTESYGAGPDIGSDHLPLLARLKIR